MAKYTIKSNVPEYTVSQQGGMTKREASKLFRRIARDLQAMGYDVALTIRDRAHVDLRGTISVFVGGLYYYVELYKES